MAVAEAEHALLRFGAGAVGPEPIADWQAKELCLSDRRVELGWGEEGSNVLERPGGTGHGDPVLSRAVTGKEGGGSVQDDSGAPPLACRARHRDVNRIVLAVTSTSVGS